MHKTEKQATSYGQLLENCRCEVGIRVNGIGKCKNEKDPMKLLDGNLILLHVNNGGGVRKRITSILTSTRTPFTRFNVHRMKTMIGGVW